MSEIHDKLRDIREGSPTPAEALQAMARVKAKEVVSQWKGYGGKNMDGVASFMTKRGEATIGGVEYHQDDEKLDSVEVWVGKRQGPPTYRLINPPMLVPDPVGEIVLTERDTLRQKNVIRRFRVDPLQAIAEFLAAQNGKSETA
mgnify:CR=1 FL=1